MDIMSIIVDLYKDHKRLGPGSDKSTLKALKSLPNYNYIKNILNIGCGTGAETLVLAKNTNAIITAIDLSAEFLSTLNKKAILNKLESKIKTIEMSMDNMNFSIESYDLLWSEGSIYHIGFKSGLSYWRDFIKPGGYLVVSEICWLTNEQPKEIEEYWRNNYPEIGTVQDKIKIANEYGFKSLNNFALMENDWNENYYTPIINKLDEFIKHYRGNADFMEVIRSIVNESKLYNKYKDFYSYVFFILKKL